MFPEPGLVDTPTRIPTELPAPQAAKFKAMHHPKPATALCPNRRPNFKLLSFPGSAGNARIYAALFTNTRFLLSVVLAVNAVNLWPSSDAIKSYTPRLSTHSGGTMHDVYIFSGHHGPHKKHDA